MDWGFFVGKKKHSPQRRKERKGQLKHRQTTATGKKQQGKLKGRKKKPWIKKQVESQGKGHARDTETFGWEAGLLQRR